MAYPSFLGQLASLDVVDPAPIPTVWVVTIKGVGLGLSVLALAGSLKNEVEGP
jgi:hypothetical protein